MPQPIALPILRPEVKKKVKYPATAPRIPPTIEDVAGAIKLSHDVYFARSESYHSLSAREYLMYFLEELGANDEELVNALKYQTALLAGDEGVFPSQSWFKTDMPYHQGVEPAWFAAAMARSLAPIQEDLAQLNVKVAGLDDRLKAVEASHTQLNNKVAGLDNRLKAVEAGNAQINDKVAGLDDLLKAVKASNAQIHRMAAIVEFPILSFHWFLTGQMQTWNRSRASGRDSELELVPFKSGDDPTTIPVRILNFHPCTAVL